MNDAEVEFIEQLGMMTKDDGLPRIAGRIYGLVLLHEQLLSLDDMADQLQVSKASVSTNARMLERMGFVERTGKPGDRKDYYRASEDAIEGNFDRMRQRMRQMLELLESTMPQVPDQKEKVQKRLQKMRDWHAFLLEDMENLLERWRASREEEGEASEGEQSK